MFPWFWVWAPHLHWPLSGDVRQRIEPDMNWFFGTIPASAGHGATEQKLFETASYGRQLGYLTEAVLAIVDEIPVKNEVNREAIVQLQELAQQLNRVKKDATQAEVFALKVELGNLRARQPALFAELISDLTS
ncbi:MAG TPA: hypothetical protein VFV39_07610 [Limnobacter sp.]|nr:hypothetical protein [Limnobacter sp.]